MATSITLTDSALLRLLQLSSASLPVGGYSFSQGLEYAVEAGAVYDVGSTRQWLQLVMHESLARLDLPVSLRLYRALAAGDAAAFHHWNRYGLAGRESRELLHTEVAMGEALLRLLKQLPVALPAAADGMEPSFVAAFSAAAFHWQLGESSCQLGLLWSWLEAQIAAAVKLVPLGQTEAQRMQGELQQAASFALARASELDDDAIGASLPGLAMASARHETQYCRLFRS